MNPSIRRFLLVNILLSITFTSSLTAIGNYYLDQKDIESHLDAFLKQASYSMQALLSVDLKEQQIIAMQQALKQSSLKYYNQTLANKHLGEKFQFQVWDEQGHLLLHSTNAPQEPLSNGHNGFSYAKIQNVQWRVYTNYDNKTGLSVIIAEHNEDRESLISLIAQDDFYIMLVTYPLLGLLIWFIVGRALSSIKRVAKAVSERAPNYLEPVNLHTVPIEIKGLVNEVNHLLLRLHQGLEREKRFAADAAHELRTPLAALKAQSQFALQAMDEEELSNALKKVIKGVDRSTHIVEQLLTLSRLTPETNTLQEKSQINLKYIITEELALLAPLAIKKRIELSLEAPDPNYPIMGNAAAITILVKNLIDNAIRYTPTKNYIHVQLEQDRHNITLTVIDSGPGIPAKLHSRVFERFYRILGTKVHGSGLGLAIVRQIADLHHAQVKLGTAKKLKGLEVNIVFPKVSSHRTNALIR